MTTRVLTFALTLGMAGWLWTPVGRSETPPPVAAFPAVAETVPGVLAGDAPMPASWGLAERDPFTAGALTFQALAGYYGQTRVGPHGPALNYAPVVLRMGRVLDTPQGDGELRGCWEALLEANYSAIVRHSGGSYIAGPVALLRYNFVQPTCVFVPYAQAGAGVTLNDAWRAQPSQDPPLVRQAFEFLLRADVGVRYMVHDCFSFDIEGGFQHISNAGLARHNGGVNNLGGSIGFTYYFGTN
jgi:hypothetical protein